MPGKSCASGDDGRDGGSRGFAGSAAGDGGVGTAANELGVHVQDIRKMEIDIITLQCAGDCADIQAVAVGGNPPYAFAWEDGSTDALRHVCLDTSTALQVAATDTAIEDDEFHYETHTANANVTANVLDCNDGGAPACDTPVPVPADGTYSGSYFSDVLAGLSGGTATLVFSKGTGTHSRAMLSADLAALLHATVALEGEVDCVTGQLVLRGIESGNGADGRMWLVTLKYDSATSAIAAEYVTLCVPGAAVCSMVTQVPPPPMPGQKPAACGPGVEVCGDSGRFTGTLQP